MVGVFRDTLGQCQIAPYSKMIPTAITGLTATSTVAGQITLSWSGGLGSNVIYTYVLSSGTIQSIGTISGNGIGTPYSVTLTLTSNTQVTTTVTLTATVLGGSTNAVSSSVTTINPQPIPLVNYSFNSGSYSTTTNEIYNMASGTAVSDALVQTFTGSSVTPYTSYISTTYDSTGGSGGSLISQTWSCIGYKSPTYPIALPTFTNGNGISFSCWIWMSSVGLPVWGSNDGSFYLYIDGASPNPLVTFNNPWAACNSNQPISYSTWHFLVGVANFTSSTAVTTYLYLDNVQIATASGTLSSKTISGLCTAAPAGFTAGTGGASNWAGSGSGANLKLDNLRYYNVALSTNNINYLYTNKI